MTDKRYKSPPPPPPTPSDLADHNKEVREKLIPHRELTSEEQERQEKSGNPKGIR